MTVWDTEIIAFKRELLMRVLIECWGNEAMAARHLGISRNTIMRQMKACGITLATVRFVCGCRKYRKLVA